jgi:uroporphyrinogen III methyltransferase/synthase
LHGVLIASIGLVTSETLRKLGLTVTLEAHESTMAGLAKALQEYFSKGH